MAIATPPSFVATGVARTGQWPAQQWLSHGEAGPHHQRALEAAKRPGFEDLYHRNLYEEQATVFTAVSGTDRRSRPARRIDVTMVPSRP